ncbi:unnamed protein product, partial [Rotaria sordida]
KLDEVRQHVTKIGREHLNWLVLKNNLQQHQPPLTVLPQLLSTLGFRLPRTHGNGSISELNIYIDLFLIEILS